MSEEQLARRRALVPDDHLPGALPVSERRDEIAAAIRDHQVVIVAGETGSGKTTQLPEDLPRARPRRRRADRPHPAPADRRPDASPSGSPRSSASSWAAPSATRCGSPTRSARDTLVKVMTDGILLAEIQRDRDLRRYDTIIIDEAHERSLNIDFLLGYLKQLLPRRPDLKVDHHLGDHRPAAVRRRTSRRRGAGADRRGVRAHLPGRDPLPAARDRDGRRRRGAGRPGHRDRRGGRGALDRVARRRRQPATSWSSSPASARSATPPRRSAAPEPAAPRRCCRCTPGCPPPSSTGSSRARRAADRAGHQRRRDVADRAGHPLRRRPRHRPHLALQPAHQGAAAADRADQPGQRQPAGRPLRPGRRRHLHPALRRGGLPRPAGVHRARDPAHQPRLGDPRR